MKPRRISLAAVVVFALVATACAGGRDAVLSRTFAGATAASKIYDSFDNAGFEARIVATAATKEAGAAALTEYRARRNKVGVALVAVFTAIGVASTDPTDASVSAALDALKAALNALKQMGVVP